MRARLLETSRPTRAGGLSWTETSLLTWSSNGNGVKNFIIFLTINRGVARAVLETQWFLVT